MVRRRCDQKPNLKYSFWRQEGKLWFADPIALQEALEKSGHSEAVIKKRMGVGYRHLQEALAGQGVNVWGANHIEWGLNPEKMKWEE